MVVGTMKATLDAGIVNPSGKTAPINGIDDYVVPTLRKQNWRVYHFHDTGKGARVKQEHNISNNKMLLYDAANLCRIPLPVKKLFQAELRRNCGNDPSGRALFR